MNSGCLIYRQIFTKTTLRSGNGQENFVTQLMESYYFNKSRAMYLKNVLIHSCFVLSLAFFCVACGQNEPSVNAGKTKEVVASERAPEDQKFTTFDGHNIAYKDSGKGRAVILLHGFINSASSWDKSVLKEQLLDAGYRVIVPDMRGNGNSDKPQNPEAYADDAEIKDIVALADHLNLKQYTAIGYSRGAIVLAKLLTEDRRINRAVIGGMGLDFTNPEWPRRKMFALAFKGETTEETQGAVDYAMSIGADLRSLHLQQEYQPVTSPDALRKVTIPVLVIAGDEDKDNGDAGELEVLFPNGKLAIVAGDHNNTYKSAVFAEAVVAFVKKGG
jgi:pimeloyl-ACP methyl ester carboxylesterase